MLIVKSYKNMYSGTSLLRPPRGLAESGLNRQVVLIDRSFITQYCFFGLKDCGLYRQVVLIERWSLVEGPLYLNIKSCVFTNGKKSDYFCSLKGVRQGENYLCYCFPLT
jgi:hypothetical protein